MDKLVGLNKITAKVNVYENYGNEGTLIKKAISQGEEIIVYSRGANICFYITGRNITYVVDGASVAKEVDDLIAHDMKYGII